MSTARRATGPTSVKGRVDNKRPSIATSAASHANPTLMYTGCTGVAPTADSEASRMALSRPAEQRTAVA